MIEMLHHVGYLLTLAFVPIPWKHKNRMVSQSEFCDPWFEVAG